MQSDTLRLAVELADPDGRFAAAQRLASHARADALLVLVEDRAVDAYLPATGFPPTLPGGNGWRELLTAARRPGIHHGVVAFPSAASSVSVLACARSGIVAAFIGGTPDAAVVEEISTVMPLLASTLRAEQDALAARGERRVALDYAREAQALATALDAARSELERTLRELEDRSRALDEARARAERAVRAKDEFLAMLGHELRNPLSPIMTALQLLRLKGQPGREQEVIERQVANLIRLVDDLLDVSRLTTGKITLRKERIEVAEVAARAVEMASPMLEAKQQILVVDIAPSGLVVDADPTRLAQVVANLLTNAAKYSDEETRILLDAAEFDGHVRIRVKDEGIGIPREMLDRIFDLFEQQRQAIDRSQGGLGLGLAIVRSLVMLHGGNVHALSDGEGKGSEFIVDLPPALPARRAAPSREESSVAIERYSSGARVLLVDDNKDAATMLADALTAMGYDVQVAHDGPAALRTAPLFRPQAAVLDIGLPVMDGYELAQRLRAVAGLGSVGLVAVTGYGQDTDRRRAGIAGFDAHLTKPVPLDELQGVLARLCSAEARDRAGHR